MEKFSDFGAFYSMLQAKRKNATGELCKNEYTAFCEIKMADVSVRTIQNFQKRLFKMLESEGRKGEGILALSLAGLAQKLLIFFGGKQVPAALSQTDGF